MEDISWMLVPCRISTYSKNSQGYAVLNKKTYGYTRHHRYVYSLYYGVKLNSDELVCHKCDNPGCSEPLHLFLGTDKDNTQDSIKKGRHVSPIHATLTEKDVEEIKDLYYSGLSKPEIAKEYGVHRTTISRIIRGVSWK